MSQVPEIFDTKINVDKEKKYDIIEKIISYFLVYFFNKTCAKKNSPFWYWQKGIKMELIKDKWNKRDIEQFNKQLASLQRPEKIDFTIRTINTKMKVLAIPIPELRKIANQIYKGNYIGYLDAFNNKYYENTIINAILINNIKDIKTKKYYISKLKIDNWSTVDILKFNIKNQEQEYLNLAKEYLKSKEEFIRRIGVRILFNYTENKDLTEIFDIINTLQSEEKYYVNMAVAWLMCELMIKNRNQTLKYLEKHRLNDFTINKTISKCRDSFRVSNEDKELLLKYRKKTIDN